MEVGGESRASEGQKPRLKRGIHPRLHDPNPKPIVVKPPKETSPFLDRQGQ